MSEPINDGGPAFSSWPFKPLAQDPSLKEMKHYSGMSLRDWFAGMALQGLLACDKTHGDFQAFCNYSYKYADTMLAQREKKS